MKENYIGASNVASKDYIDRVLRIAALFLGFFATIPLIRVASVSLYVWLMALTAIVLVLSCRLNIRLTIFHLVWLSAVITFAINQPILSESWGHNNFNGLMAITLVALVADTLFSDSNRAEAFVKGVLAASKLQIVWIFLQFGAYRLLGIDVNELIFNSLLGMAETTSQYKSTGLAPSGLCWNAGGIAAALLVQFALGDKGYWRILCVVACLLTQSSTTIIGVAVILIFKALLQIRARQAVFISKSTIVAIGGIIVATAATLICVPSFATAAETVVNALLGRVQMLLGMADYDSSFDAHLNYYLNIPHLIEEMTPVQLLFGYGIDCSGLPYSELTSQYWWMESWFLESDPMNSFLGMGLVGMISIYFFLFRIIKSAWVGNRIVSLLVVTFIICGIFYDIQSVLYYWLFMLEICLSRLGSRDVANPFILDARKTGHAS